MILNSDLILYHKLWERADLELCSKEGISLFNRLVDIYVIACAIGIKADKSITLIDEPLQNPKTIGRNTYTSLTNTDLRDVLDFMLQNALINSRTIDCDIEERLKLAFDPDYTTPKISAGSFLTGFANYGIREIFTHIDSQSALVAVEELNKYFEELSESEYEELLKNISLEDIN